MKQDMTLLCLNLSDNCPSHPLQGAICACPGPQGSLGPGWPALPPFPLSAVFLVLESAALVPSAMYLLSLPSPPLSSGLSVPANPLSEAARYSVPSSSLFSS